MRTGLVKKSILSLAVCLALTGCWKSSEERAAEHLERGKELVAEGDLDRAFVEFRNTLKYDKTNIEARREMAGIHVARGAKVKAYRNYLSVAENDPTDLPVHTVLSELAFDIGSWDEFNRNAPKAIALAKATPPEADQLTQRIAALDLALRYRQATVDEDAAEQGIILVEAEAQEETTPDNTIIRKILIEGYVKEGRYDEALTQIEAAIAADPDTIDNYNAKLELLFRMDNPQGVEDQLRLIIDRFPEDDASKLTLMRYLVSRGQVEQAEAFLRDLVAAAPEGEERNSAYTDLVTFIVQRRGLDEGLAELETILAATPNDRLRMMRASMKFDMGARDEALREMEQIVAAGEESTLTPVQKQDANILLARMLVADGNEVGARKLVEEVLAADPTAVGALKMQASWLTQNDDTDGAINALRAALDNAPQDAEAMTLMAQAYQRAGQPDLMLEFLSLAVEATGNAPEESLRYASALINQDKALQAEAVLISSLRIAAGNVDVLSRLGQVYIIIEDLPRARQVVDTLRQIDTDQARSNADKIYVELVAREQGSEEALQYLEGLAAQDGDEGMQAKLSIIRARISSGDGDGALSYARTLLEEDPDNINYRYALAITHATQRDYPEARSLLREVLEAQPDTVQAWLQLSRVQVAEGDRDAAIATVNEGLEAVPGSADLQWAKASFLQTQGDVDGAIEIFEDLYARNSDSLVVANNLASLLSTYRRDADSLARARAIARRFDGTTIPALQDTYGWIQHRSGNSEEAVTYLEPAAEGLPRDVTVQVHLGLAYAAVGRRDDALAQLRRALDIGGPLGGNAPILDEARAKIAELEAGPEATQTGAEDQN